MTTPSFCDQQVRANDPRPSDTSALQRLNLHYNIEGKGQELQVGHVNHVYFTAIGEAIQRASVLRPPFHKGDAYARVYSATSTALAWLPHSIPVNRDTPLTLHERLDLLRGLLPSVSGAPIRSKADVFPVLCADLLGKAAVIVVHTNAQILQQYSLSMGVYTATASEALPSNATADPPALAEPVETPCLTSLKAWRDLQESWLQPMMLVTAARSLMKQVSKKAMGHWIDVKV